MAATIEAWDRVASVVYASNPDEADQAYTKWAGTYDNDICNTLANASHDEFVKNTIVHLRTDESALLLDLAAGTGLCGEALRRNGYKGTMDALELNVAMLKKAEEKGIYRNHTCYKMSPDEDLPVDENTYDTATISGAFLPNHLEEGCILPIMKCLKKGGILVFNCRNTDANKEYRMGLERLLDETVKSGKLCVVEVKEILSYREKCQETGGVMTAILYVYKKL